jgi:hypothetical protein
MIENLMCRFQLSLPRLYEAYPAGLMVCFPDVPSRRDNVVTILPEVRVLICIFAHDIIGSWANFDAHSVAV